MKKTKIIIPALGLLLLSTAASVTGTVAWFSMNNSVSATGMNIQAKAESGIVISNEAKQTWKETAQASHNDTLAVYPTSTYNATTWAHGKSSDADIATEATAGQGQTVTVSYSMLDIAEDAGVGFVDSNSDNVYSNAAQEGTKYTQDEIDAAQEGDPAYGKTTDNWKIAPTSAAESAYYLKNSFFIKSSAEQIASQTIYITNVQASVGTSNSGELDKALRVLVKSGSTVKVFAPVSGATATYTVVTAVGSPNTTQSVTAIDSSASEGHVPYTAQSFLTGFTVPAYSAEATQVDVYVYFEGEDANCKSTNLNVQSLDTLQVSVKFSLASVADPVVPNP